MNSRKESTRTKRSNNGCLTCVQAKVKCPENRPRCQRCSRMGKECNWPGPRLSLRERRRGHGPLKNRESFKPRPIQPLTTTTPSPSDDGVPSPDLLLASSYSSPDFELSCPSAAVQPSLTSVPAPLSTRHIPSSCSVLFGPLEQDALYFYENVFATLSPKSFLWSSLAILLRYGYDHAMIMHLLLASCLGQMSQGRADEATRRATRSHFEAGTRLLIASLRAEKPDHCQSIMAFWLVQLTYASIWDRKASLAMDKLSISITQYVKKHHLLDLILDKDHLRGGSVRDSGGLCQSPSSAVRSVLARFLLFAAYEDLDAEFCDSGGYLSSLVLTGDEIAERVFVCSQSSQSQFFGATYPLEELMDDVERSTPLELHVYANVALGQLNRIRKRGCPTVEQLESLRSHLQAVKQRYLSIFHLAETPHTEGKGLMITTYNIIAHFNAVLICILNAMVPLSGDQDVAQELEAAKQGLLYCVWHSSLNGRGRPLMPRNQWPVFIAAIEADDVIHADWLLKKLGNNRYATLVRERVTYRRGTRIDGLQRRH
ncbi:hypothetical protein CONLIGDRAFT_718415 [Coniochaeta ligniaria NRRL 30616]|uniref:Zn(2)-C6 fungal-type domain-containing protein n=1 Tax=Coniochaeta ligniaria NRRL 30616 TaxID=1408157 RepID=A0A1J7IAJ5_9PEZI|nr:hypothetical protein CONLIGDRAFT_718415 [Coniochaeta ligniaria NRRL 30616]